MLLEPKKFKYRKAHKGRNKNFISPINKPYHFQHNTDVPTVKIFSKSNCRLTARQIESVRIGMNRLVKKFGKLEIHVFPNVPVTRKPTENRMGKGKGSFDRWVCRVKAGKLLFSMSNVPLDIALKAAYIGNSKLPVKTMIRIY